MKKDSGAAFLVGMFLTLVVFYAVSWVISSSGYFTFDAATLVATTIFVVLLWTIGWNAQRRPRPQ